MLQANQRLGEFKVLRLLGKGGMGEVYEAEQSNPRRRVAVKVLAPWLAGNEDALERFWREASVPAQLDHPGIVRIISTGKTEDGIAYYTMHLVRGISVGELIRQSVQIPLQQTQPMAKRQEPTPSQGAPKGDLEEAPAADREPEEGPPAVVGEYLSDRFQTTARIGVLAARVLASAHQKGFLHRDIKPSNLMLDYHGHLYLVDFGLTRSLQGGAGQTSCGAVIGTPWYMSPEQARSETLDERSDIYSLGVTLYELATGGPGPFTADRDNTEAVLAQVRAGTHLPVRTLAPGIPAALENVISTCIHSNPRRRYPRAAELVHDLESYLQSRPPPYRSRSILPGRLSGKTLARAGSAVAALLLAGLLALVFHSPPKTPDPGQQVETPAPHLDDRGRPYPDSLRNRRWNVSAPLLDDDFNPLWYRKVNGTGVCWPMPRTKFLWVTSPPESPPTMIALDDDPGRRWFRFSLELQHYLVKDKPTENNTGIFFGFPSRRSDVARYTRCFAVQLDEQPRNAMPHGQLAIGTMAFEVREGSEGAFRNFRPLPADKGSIKLLKSQVLHKVTVEVVNSEITVTVDEKLFRHFDMAWLKNQDPEAARGLSPLGALGVWAESGQSYYRNIFVAILPGDNN